MISLEPIPAATTKPKRKLSAGLLAYQAKQRALKAAGAAKAPAKVSSPPPAPKKAVAVAKKSKPKPKKRSTSPAPSFFNRRFLY